MRPLRPASQEVGQDVEEVQDGGAAAPIAEAPTESTLAAVQARQKQIARDTRQWDEKQFMADLGARKGAEQVAVAERILQWAKPLRIWWGKGKVDGSLFPMLDNGGVRYWMFSIWSYGRVEILFQYMKGKPPFDREDLRLELARRLNTLPGVEINRNALSKRPTFPLAVITDEATLETFLSIFDWYIHTVRSFEL